jgi:hypothetical protein
LRVCVCVNVCMYVRMCVYVVNMYVCDRERLCTHWLVQISSIDGLMDCCGALIQSYPSTWSVEHREEGGLGTGSGTWYAHNTCWHNTHTHIHRYIHVYTHAYTYIRTHIILASGAQEGVVGHGVHTQHLLAQHTHTNTLTRMHTHTYSHTNACVHTYANTHRYIHVHTHYSST